MGFFDFLALVGFFALVGFVTWVALKSDDRWYDEEDT